MTSDIQELAGRYRDILRQAVFLVRSMDAEGELSIGHLSTLNMVAAEPMRVGAIARNAGIKVPSATEQIIKLELAELVERVPDPADARGVLVRLTSKGQDVREAANTRRNGSMARALQALSGEEVQAIAAALPAIAKLNEALAGGHGTGTQQDQPAQGHNPAPAPQPTKD